jgi:methylglutaconyl-CoA hydratase
MNENGYVTYSIENKIATVEFGHPASNSLPCNIFIELANIISSVGKEDAVNVIVLRSAGERAFCAGASFDELIAIQDEKEGLDFFSGFANVINAMRSCGKIIIGRVQGKAVGGGVGVASSCDYCLATKFSSVKLSELAIGIGPFVVGPAVERKTGTAAFSQLALDATTWYDATWAKTNGIYAEVLDDATALDEAVNKLANTLANSNPEALSMLKDIFWQGTDHWSTLLYERAQTSGTLVLSEFTRDAINKFKGK